MKKIAIIGGGIIGMTLANYLDTEKFDITVFDSGNNQATGASAGIISPWLSKRRNKQWYALAKDGAAFFEQLVKDLSLDETIYEKCGTLFVRSPEALQELEQLALERRATAPEIGEVRHLTTEETTAMLPLLKPVESLYISGGARLDGKAYLQHLRKHAQTRGVRVVSEEAHVKKENAKWRVTSVQEEVEVEVDELVLTPGPALKTLLDQLGYTAKVSPQKGQLLSFETNFETEKWPVAFLEGEADLIPFQNGRLLLGATHENEAGWDLEPTQEAFEQLTKGVQTFLKEDYFADTTYSYRVGTRAYTDDFAPFFGPVEQEEGLSVASGLGSSGLTTGPYIAYLLAQHLNANHSEWEMSHYQKEMNLYVNKKEE
ncbi:NAD(P)/FAD-dependent oxidoreductase [Lactococcus formosensis]|uniref:NAD(P)/FAD-dependent oxidoreductase n=1 Tax=Lactococcus formosensis TaxID=1281486 RepID=UPI0025500A65|nr:FAD-dependent oxidoreductase [Lactococcus formosensis]